MCIVRFISDLHFGHGNMAIRRGFTTVDEHDAYIIEQWNKIVNKRDITYILGDITMEKISSYHLLDRLNGVKKVILGNHDRSSHVPELLKYVSFVGGMVQYKGHILTHCPIHPSQLEFRYSKNIHGHLHLNSLDDERYINVSAEVVNYTPKTLDELKNIEKFKL